VRQLSDFVVPRPRSYPSRWTSWVHESLWTWIDDRPQILGYRMLYGDGSKLWYLVNPKIAGKWMFIPLKCIYRYWPIAILGIFFPSCLTILGTESWPTNNPSENDHGDLRKNPSGRVLQKSQHGCVVGSRKKMPWIHPKKGGPKIGWFKIWTNDQFSAWDWYLKSAGHSMPGTWRKECPLDLWLSSCWETRLPRPGFA